MNRTTGNGQNFPTRGGGEDIFHDADELDLLREELLDAYSTPREKIITRDQLTERKRTEFAQREAEKRLTISEKKKPKDPVTLLKIKAKQDALKRLYEHVLVENHYKKEHKKRHRKKHQDEASKSSGSFHKMYTVFHDPLSGREAKMVVGSDEELVLVDNADSQEGPIKVVDITAPSKPEDNDKMMETSSAKERSKFVLKKRLSSLKSKPPPLLEELKLRIKKDARYSEEKDRYSFDVDVLGPFLQPMDPNKRKPKMRTVAIQAMVVEETDVRKSGDMGSQTDVEIASSQGWGDKRSSKGTNQSDKSGFYFNDEFGGEDQEDGYEELAAGDASSSNASDADEFDLEDIDEKNKTLERKDSRRREAETMVRPRGYRDLDLGESHTLVTFEAETCVTAHDLDRDEGKRRGIVVSRDNVLWPSCSEFDMDLASRKIEDYIKRCWTIDPKWMFVIHPLEVYHDNYRKKYVFEVKFSIPSPTTPVPPATASVFFVFEIPTYSMKEDQVSVSYVLEGTRFPHQPGGIPFQDKWLWGIISDKLRVQKAINF